MRIPASDLLGTYDLPSLQQMARQRGLNDKQTKKKPLVKSLAKVLYDADAIGQALEDLTQLERTLLDRLILAGGDTLTEIIRGQLDYEGLIQEPEKRDYRYYSSYYHQEQGSVRARGSTKFEDLVARLGLLGLVFTSEPLQSSGWVVDLRKPGRRLLIPEDVLQHLPQVDIAVETAPPPAAVQEADPAPLLRDIYLLLSLADREPIPLTARGLVPKRTLARINAELRRSEDVAAVRSEEELAWIPLVRGLAEGLGLLVASVGGLRLDTRGEEFLRLPDAERRAQLYEAYRETRHWCELFRIPDMTIRGKGASVRSAPPGVVAARQQVLAKVAGLPVGEWITLRHLTERLRQRAYEFLLSRARSANDYYSYYGHAFNPYPNTNELGVIFDALDERSGWGRVEAQFIHVIVVEGLHALGIVDLGATDGEPTAFRITSDGARLMKGEPLPAVERSPDVVIQPNFQIFAFDSTGEDILFTLDRIAERVRADRATEYELTRESIYRAQQAGMDGTTIIGFLERVSTVGLPQNVRRTLEEWSAQHERITVRRHTPLLHTVDETVLDRLYADPELGRLLGRRVAPTAALVPGANLQQLNDRLVAGGDIPSLTEGPDAEPGTPVNVDKHGRLTFHQPLPSIYVLRELHAFADDDDGAMLLTVDSLRRGARNNQSADDVIAILERLSAGTLPAEVASLIRRWAKDWGHGALIQTAVLQVGQAQTLTDLLADPEIKPYLQRIPGVSTLALVRPEGFNPLRTLLKDRGMVLENQLLR